MHSSAQRGCAPPLRLILSYVVVPFFNCAPKTTNCLPLNKLWCAFLIFVCAASANARVLYEPNCAYQANVVAGAVFFATGLGCGFAAGFGAVALAEAISYVESVGMANIEQHEQGLLRLATERLSAIEGLRIYGQSSRKCPIVSFTVEGTHPYDVGMILDKLGIAIRTGHHCAEPVMTHFGVSGMCRASFAMYNTAEEVELLARGVERAIGMLR